MYPADRRHQATLRSLWSTPKKRSYGNAPPQSYYNRKKNSPRKAFDSYNRKKFSPPFRGSVVMDQNSFEPVFVHNITSSEQNEAGRRQSPSKLNKNTVHCYYGQPLETKSVTPIYRNKNRFKPYEQREETTVLNDNNSHHTNYDSNVGKLVLDRNNYTLYTQTPNNTYHPLLEEMEPNINTAVLLRQQHELLMQEQERQRQELIRRQHEILAQEQDRQMAALLARQKQEQDILLYEQQQLGQQLSVYSRQKALLTDEQMKAYLSSLQQLGNRAHSDQQPLQPLQNPFPSNKMTELNITIPPHNAFISTTTNNASTQPTLMLAQNNPIGNSQPPAFIDDIGPDRTPYGQPAVVVGMSQPSSPLISPSPQQQQQPTQQVYQTSVPIPPPPPPLPQQQQSPQQTYQVPIPPPQPLPQQGIQAPIPPPPPPQPLPQQVNQTSVPPPPPPPLPQPSQLPLTPPIEPLRTPASIPVRQTAPAPEDIFAEIRNRGKSNFNQRQGKRAAERELLVEKIARGEMSPNDLELFDNDYFAYKRKEAASTPQLSGSNPDDLRSILFKRIAAVSGPSDDEDEDMGSGESFDD